MTAYKDFSQYLTTGPLLKSSWLLASDSIGILLNTSKPSIRGLFVFGFLGRLHNLLFDMDCLNLYSDLYGIYPYYTKDGTERYPFRSGMNIRTDDSFDISGSREIEVLPETNTAHLRSMAMFAKGNMNADGIMPMLTIQVRENSLHITAQFPEDAEECGLHLPWYPLYDTYTTQKGRRKLQYYKEGLYGHYPDHFCEEISGSVRLEDTLSRQASVQIAVQDGFVQLRSCTKKEYGDALYISTDARTKSHTLDVTITILPAAVTVSGTQYYPCGSEGTITLRQGETEKKHTFSVSSEPGIHTLQLDSKHVYPYCAVPDDWDRMKRAADACLEIFWKEGRLSGVPPYAFDPTLLEPQLRAGMWYCSHGMRSMSILCAEGVHAEDISYVDTAAHAIRQVERVSYHGEDGSVFTPLIMDENGDPGNYVNSCRPSDTGILIRGIVQVAKAYLHFGKTEKAREYTELARNYAKTIAKMQCEDGSFYDRYRYPTAEPSVTNKGTVNNWCLQLWRLLPLLRHFSMTEDAAWLEKLIRRYIRYQIEKENSILYISGGGEDASDFGDALNTDATLFAMQYVLTGEPVWKQYAEQALKKSWLMSCMWADMPQYFGLYGNSDLGCFYDRPMGLFSAGGMHDLTAVEANLFAAEVLNSTFAADMAEALHNGRLGSFIRDNGGMYMVMFQCPGYFHRDERHSEMLMYGGVGVYAWNRAQKESDVLGNMRL